MVTKCAYSFRILSAVLLIITVLDINDCKPNFTNPSFDFSVDETDQIGMVISVEIAAEDCDAGDNGIVRFSLPNDADGKVKIDEITGMPNLFWNKEQIIYSLRW